MTESTRTAPVTIILHGSSGRMGRAVASLAGASDGITLAGALELRAERKAAMGENQRSFDRIPPELTSGAAVVIDFSRVAAIAPLIRALTGSGVPLVSGTTGLGAGERDLLEKYAEETAVFYDENMSYGVSLLKDLAARAYVAFGPSADVEIVETHHRYKQDAPSGTAHSLARTLAAAKQAAARRHEPKNTDKTDIPIHSLRVGGVTGEHRVVFATNEECLAIEHRALTRDVFARGALRAARFVAQQSKGLYDMSDLVGRGDG